MKKKKNWLRAAVMVALVSLILWICYLVLRRFMPDLIPLLRRGDADEIEAYIRSFGSFKGAAVTFILQWIQVVSVVFPAMAILVSSGIIFGWFRAFLLCYASFCSANIAVFLFARRFSGRDGLMPGENDERTQKKFRFITESEYPEYTVMLAYMMPFLPNGIVPYVAARTHVSLKRFSAAMAVGSMPTIVVFCAIGGRILHGDFVFAAALFAVALVCILIMYFLRDKVMLAARRAVQALRGLANKLASARKAAPRD